MHGTCNRWPEAKPYQHCEISTTLIGLLIPVAVTSGIKLFSAVLDSLLWLPHHTQEMKCKTRRWLRRCSLYIVDLVERGDQAVPQTHGVANLSPICCAYITTHENEHCFDDIIYCIYITLLGYMVQTVLAYLTQWLMSSGMIIAHSWFTKQHQSDHPCYANGKYWSRVRYRHRKADQKRHCKLLTSLLEIAKYVRSIFVGSIDMLLAPVYTWKAKTGQSTESASNEKPEQESCPISGTHGGKDRQGHLRAEPCQAYANGIPCTTTCSTTFMRLCLCICCVRHHKRHLSRQSICKMVKERVALDSKGQIVNTSAWASQRCVFTSVRPST